MLYSTKNINIINGMRIFATLLTFLIVALFQKTLASDAEFGKYCYSQYLGVQQQLQNQRMNALRRQRMYNQNPTRNIRYPSMNNPYPNIQRTNYALNPRQRYSAQYYNRYYR